MVFRPVQALPRPLRALAAALALACSSALLPAAARADCPGRSGRARTPPRRQIGQRAEGVMRFPQALAIGPDGSVYVADQGSHVVQVFGPDGVFRREIGIAGTKPGQLSGVGAIAVAGDGSVLVADGSNRIDRFDANGQLDRLLGPDGQRRRRVPLRRGRRQHRRRGRRPGRVGGLRLRGRHRQRPRPALHARRRPRRRDRAARPARQPARDRGARHAPVRGRRPAPSARRLRHGRAPAARGRPERLGPGQLNFPYGVATDAAGRVFVADDLNHRVVRFSSGPAVPLQGPLGLLRDRAGAARLPARDRGRRGRPRRRCRPRRPRSRAGRRAGPARSRRSPSGPCTGTAAPLLKRTTRWLRSSATNRRPAASVATS